MSHSDEPIYFGKDMHGAHVFQGDTVMLVGPMIREERKGLTGVVTGEAPENYKRLMLENRFDPMGAMAIDGKTLAHVSHVVKVSDAASWGEIERYTGWSPGWTSGPGLSFSAFGSVVPGINAPPIPPHNFRCIALPLINKPSEDT